MRTLLYQWVKSNSVMVVNAGSLVGTTAITSVLGFAYWWLAARRFSPEEVGIASASVSVMMLLGSFCMLGLGTLLITELPRQPGKEASLISTALIIVGVAGACIGIGFALAAPFVSANLQPIRASIESTVIFASGVSFTAITLVLDQALIGLLRGGLQLWRNTIFAISKLIILLIVGLWLSKQTTGMTIYLTWAIGSGLSLSALVCFALSMKRGRLEKADLPQWDILRKLGPAALQHHLLNLTLQAPTLILPILVTVLLSAAMNAWFYVAWMIASFVFVIPIALTTVLHATNSAQPSTLSHKARVTISLALVTSVLANCLLQFDTKQVLSLFGSSYATQAAWSLRILGFGAFPLIIKNHYISICRIQNRIVRAMFSMLPGGLLELVAATLGAHFGGLAGLSFGWVAAVLVESVYMLPTVYKTVRSVQTSQLVSIRSENRETETIWLLDTIVITAIKPVPREIKAYTSIIGVQPMRSRVRHKGTVPSSLRPIRLQGDIAIQGSILPSNNYINASDFADKQYKYSAVKDAMSRSIDCENVVEKDLER